MIFPKLIILKTRHYDYKYHVKNKTQYIKIGIDILDLMKHDLKWIHETKEEKTFEEALADVFGYPYEKIKELFDSEHASHIKLIGKKSDIYQSGYDTPCGNNIKEQLSIIKKNRKDSRIYQMYVEKLNNILSGKEKKGIWDVVEFFAEESLLVETYDNN